MSRKWVTTDQTNATRAARPKHWRRWSARDDERLKLLWGTGTLDHIAAEIGRSRDATYMRARQLRLTAGPPQGHEYLSDAAVRTGFAVATLRRILRAHGVYLAHVVARPCSSSEARSRHMHVVDSAEVDMAVEAWCAEEYVENGAERHGMCGDTLKRILLGAGHKPPKRVKARWRVRSEEIDRVVAAHRAQLADTASVRAHAARVGLSPITLGNRLRKAGVLGPKRPGVQVRLPASIVDAALSAA